MFRRYLMTVTKRQHVRVIAESEEGAFEKAEEEAMFNSIYDEVCDVELEEVEEEDVDSYIDDRALRGYADFIFEEEK